MNKNTIIGLVLIFALMIGYTWWASPTQEELARQQYTRDSTFAAQAVEQQQLEMQAQQQTQPDTLPAETTTSVSEPENATAAVNRYGAFAGSTVGSEQDFLIETDLLRLTISSKGGRISQVELKDYVTFDGKPLLLFVPDSSMFDIGFYADNRIINTSQFYFKPQWTDSRFNGKDHLQISDNDSLSFAMRLYVGVSDSVEQTDKYIEFVYALRNDRYMVDFDVKFVNMEGVLPINTKDLNINWNARLLRQEKSLSSEKMNTTVHYRHSDGEVDYLSERKDDAKRIQTRVKWVSFKQQFFASTLIAVEYFSHTEIEKIAEPEKELRYLENMSANLSVPYNPAMDKQVGMHFYFGPLKYNILRKYKLDLERQIPLGWSFFLMQWINRFAVIPVFNLLEGFNLNYGIIILILTVLLKIVLFPIAYKTYMSSAKMRVLKPEIDEINAKFPKKEDAMKKQQAVMTLYKKAGANPMSGCIPMLLQFPILLAMFRFFPASIELRQESFLWANDLSSYDSILDLPFNIPFYGDHVSLFTLLMTISTIIYTKINNEMMSTGNQMPGMKMMMYVMPLMFLGFFNSYSSGLSYYYLLANLLTFAQMFLFRSFVNEDKLHAQIQENKKKPVKKSNFQKRLEEMAKNQGKR
ncbi:MAG: membrane protein insertase YidC [Lentimicrobiaceae bacterium]|nr:membrane protein insertase YidC [Lentimicrobiaceae bacterium]